MNGYRESRDELRHYEASIQDPDGQGPSGQVSNSQATDGYNLNSYGDGDGSDESGGDAVGLLDRRRFLQVMVAGGAAAAGAGIIYSGADRESAADPVIEQPGTQVGVVNRPNTEPDRVGQLLPSAVDNRVLVLIELAGGNDGPSTVVPYGNGTYYDLRPNIAIPPEEVLSLDNEVGLNPNLARLHQRGLAVVEGVGPTNGNLSHFEMVQRWDAGDMDGTNNLKSGFLARLADTVNNGSPLVGLSVGGNTPRFANSAASTLAIDNINAIRYLTQSDDPALLRYHESLRSFTTDEAVMAGVVGSSWRQLLELGVTINAQIERENDETNPMFTDGGGLGRRLSLAANLISADVGVRVVHAAIGGFDTHTNHRNRHNNLMGQLDASIAGFLQQMEQDGTADRVLVATTSEFGRRFGENDGGTDHGSGSLMLMAGPVTPGRYGVPSPLNGLDGGGNLSTEVPFDTYLATLAQGWLGIEATSVLPGEPEILPLF